MSVDKNKSTSGYYDHNYFAWQRNIGFFGAWANSHKFIRTVQENDFVIDFGCGGGYLLGFLSCARKIGIEPNLSARDVIRKQGVEHFLSPKEVLENLGGKVADVIISNHALEHTLNPLHELQSLRNLLKDDGVIHFFVPCDSINYSYNPQDISYHLYSWSPQNLGNLFYEAGFEVIYSRKFLHKWPPFYGVFSRLGWPIFNLICRIYARLDRSWGQVEIKAKKRKM